MTRPSPDDRRSHDAQGNDKIAAVIVVSATLLPATAMRAGPQLQRLICLLLLYP